MVALSRAPQENARLGKRISSVLLEDRTLITILSIVLLASVIVLVYPFVPYVKYSLGLINDENPYASRLDTYVTQSGDSQGEVLGISKPFPQDNRLVIPKIGVDAEIVEGDDADDSLERGIWRVPKTAESPEEGNMVLTAHRFRFLPPSNRTFYLLDKLKVGDTIIVYWEGEEFDYIVTEEFIVEPEQVEILDPTDTPRLTLYTCTPLFTTDKRLVLVAEPM